MYKVIFTLLVCLIYNSFFFSQANIVINDDAYIIMNNGTELMPIYVVLDNEDPNSLTTLGTGGNLVSEGEFNKFRWMINSSSGLYILPYTTENDIKIPNHIDIVTGGTGGAHVDFSTFPTDVMNFPRPSMVQHMNDAATGTEDNSEWVIDRFWMIDAMNYTERPTAIIDFNYDPDETIDNFLDPGSMVAQRYNSDEDLWSGSSSMSYLFWGTDNLDETVVENCDPPAEELFETWTLVERWNLLPVTLTAFDANCRDEYVEVNWTTETEVDASHFILEKSIDGYSWNHVSEIKASGNSSKTINYSYEDRALSNSTVYYRLVQYDFDGSTEIFGPISAKQCGSSSFDVKVFKETESLYRINALSNNGGLMDINVYSLSGQKVKNTDTKNLSKGENSFLIDLNILSTGMYIMNFINGEEVHTHKLIINK